VRSELHGTERAFSHQALFYRNARDYQAGAVPFVLDGLARDQPVAVAVPARQRRLLASTLGLLAQDVEFIEMEEVGRNPGRLLPAVLQAFVDQHAGQTCRILGEPVWSGRSAEEYPACVQHEALVNLAFEGRTADLLCPYDVAALGPEVVRDVEATHPSILDADGHEVRQSTRYAPDEAYERYNEPLFAPADVPVVAFDIETLAAARRAATEFAARCGTTEARLADLALAVGEVCANSVQHGGGHGELAVWSRDDMVVCQVSDRGRLLDRLAGRRLTSVQQYDGRGLYLVHQVADLIRTHVADDGLTTHIHLRRT
jgi:anti-sigma regulatory factor (Ser/Thr protein kinase)